MLFKCVEDIFLSEFSDRLRKRILCSAVCLVGADDEIPSRSTCKSVVCAKGRKCGIRKGKPKCVCAPKCSKKKHKQPLCGSDGRTYRNYCSLMKRECRKNTKISIEYNGRCKKSCTETICSGRKRCVVDQNLRPHCVKCWRPCRTRTHVRPICGVDGVTYKSNCHLRQASCLKGKAIALAYPGKCKPKATCVSIKCGRGQRCLTELNTLKPRCTQCRFDCKRWGRDPVCASDNRTYSNWCQMMKRSCQTGIVIEPTKDGPCILGK
ncbi:Follistatin [Nymphon striatum]|nr:Follistatin [Nymphon striatum]